MKKLEEEKVQLGVDVDVQKLEAEKMSQQYQAGTTRPVTYPMGLGSNPGDNPINPVVPNFSDMAEMDTIRVKLPKQLKYRCKWLEEKFKDMDSNDYFCGVDAKELNLILDLEFLRKFKTLEFEKYNGTSCLEAHITMFFRRMMRYVNNDQLLIHCFQDSLIGSAAKCHVTDMTPDRITLQNMEKKQNESFCQYAQRWRKVATHVQLPLLKKETTMLFINTLKAPFINHMLGSATKSFSDIVMSGEMIKNAIRSWKTNAEENAKRSAPRKKENEVNTANVGLIMQDSKEIPKGVRSYCELHAKEGHDIQESTEFKALVQSLMDNNELEFFEDVKGSEGGDVCATEEGPMVKVYKVNHLVVIISQPTSNEVGAQVTPRIIIQKPVAFPYKDSKGVLWNYDCNVMIPGEENSVGTSKGGQDIGFFTRSGKRYNLANARTEPLKEKTLAVEHKKEKTARLESPVNEPVNENEAKKFLKFLKHSEPWVHSAGAVLSLLHQKLKLVTEGRLVMINAEKDIIASVLSDAPHIGTDEEAIECSFRSLEFVNATFIVEGNKILMPNISKTTRMGL
ncbi:Gag-pro-like protein [Gossypium australe]|uniref:Gag-pro-like protein n=1 Tax=Gossypium australe TaxID=47621 RepID=A0A5B6UZU6_9ROSI|nr:Gag-pro-like protein [Gossypium australe]